MEHVIAAAHAAQPCTVDITGGAPELNPNFRRFVSALRDAEIPVTVRTNLTVFFEPGVEGTPEFYRDHGVKLVASLPCYLEDNVDAQRGDGVFQKSIASLQKLNELGYGIDPLLVLDLVYNPQGAALPPDQASLEAEYKDALNDRFGIVFSGLNAITNMPIGRFFGDLKRDGLHTTYMEALQSGFNEDTVEGLMCRNQISVRWDGTVFDCDFNLALKTPVDHGAPNHIRDFDLKELAERRIVTGEHCFGCTAGVGSSCGGALVELRVESSCE